MNKIIKKAIKIFTLNLVFVISFSLLKPALLLDSATALAVGDLIIDWGVPEGSPIFTISNLSPGQTETRTVKATNAGTGIRPIGIKGVRTAETNNFSQVLSVTISEGALDIYGGTSLTGPKNLSDFFAESASINGIFLSNVNSSQTVNYQVKVKFQETAGNEFQNSQLVFDLKMGISIDLPDECELKQFTGDPIFGTSKGDKLTGTDSNDIIVGFEGGDSIDAKSGDDCVIGGPGGDTIKGGNGNDIIDGNEGGDKINGDNGEDLIFGGSDSDSVSGGNGDDTINGNAGNDSLNGESGQDKILGESGIDSLKGGNGNDELNGGGQFGDLANGEAGSDKCGLATIKNCESGL